MPYKTGSLKGKLTTAEIRKLVRAHNKLSKITIPAKSDRDTIINIIAKSGFRINHEQQRLEQTSKKDITLDKAKEATKIVRKTDEQKQQAKEKKEKKEKAVKSREGELIKAGAVLGKARAKAQAKKEKPKPKPKGVSVGVGTDKPKPVEKKKLAIEDKPKKPVGGEKTLAELRKELGFKIETRERTQMLNALSDEMKRKINPFQVIGISQREESPAVVKKMCKELRLKEHPDKGGDPEKFDLIQKVCKILLDTQTLTKKSGNDKDKGEAEKKPDTRTTIMKIFDELVENSDEKILPFTSLPDSSLLFYSVILEKNKNDCSVPVQILSSFFKMKDPTAKNSVKLLKKNAKIVAEAIVDCHTKSKGKKAVVIPITLATAKGSGTHANALLLNT